MNEAGIVQSVASASASIGVRAAKHIDVIFRELMSGPGTEHTEGYTRKITGEPHPLGNVAILGASADPEGTRVAIAPLCEGAFPSAVLFPQGASPEVIGVVTALGFKDSGSMPAMAVDIGSMAVTSLPSGYEFARVGSGDGKAWTDTLAIGYGLPRGVARLFSPEAVDADPAADARVQFFAVKRGGQIVATSLLFLADGLAGIYCVATLADERGKGLGAHATAEPLLAAQGLGYRVGVLQSSPDGHNVYLRLGFKDVGGVPMFVRIPA